MAVGAKRNRCKRAKISALARRASAQRPVGQQLRTVPTALGARGTERAPTSLILSLAKQSGSMGFGA